MPDSLDVEKAKAERELKKTKVLRPRQLIAVPERLALELAREWNSPGDWFHQHLYVE